MTDATNLPKVTLNANLARLIGEAGLQTLAANLGASPRYVSQAKEFQSAANGLARAAAEFDGSLRAAKTLEVFAASYRISNEYRQEFIEAEFWRIADATKVPAPEPLSPAERAEANGRAGICRSNYDPPNDFDCVAYRDGGAI